MIFEHAGDVQVFDADDVAPAGEVRRQVVKVRIPDVSLAQNPTSQPLFGPPFVLSDRTEGLFGGFGPPLDGKAALVAANGRTGAVDCLRRHAVLHKGAVGGSKTDQRLDAEVAA